MSNKPPMMKCGHAANAIRDNDPNKPACAICAGIAPGALEVAEEIPDLEGRTAKCFGCRKMPKSTKPSDTSLAFFMYRPDLDFDEFYCGCFGWN